MSPAGHVVLEPGPPRTLLGGAATLQLIPLGQDNLGWRLTCNATGATALVDGPDAVPYLESLASLGLTLSALFITHTHGDHIGVAADLQGRRQIALRRGEADPWPGLRTFGPRPRAAEVPGLTDAVDEGDEVALGALRLQVWRTEGHLRGHISYVLADEKGEKGEKGAIFCGDTMFGGGCGYLFDGPPAAMLASLQRIAALPPTTLLCCAHEYTWDNLHFALSVAGADPAYAAALGDRITRCRDLRAAGRSTLPSTIGEERATNPFLHAAQLVAALPDRGAEAATVPPDAAAAFTALRAAKDSRLYKPSVPPDPSLTLRSGSVT